MGTYERRLAAVRAAMAKRDIEMLFVPPSSNYQYLTGIRRNKRSPVDPARKGDEIRGAFIGIDGQLVIGVPELSSPPLLDQLASKPWITDVRVYELDEDPIRVASEILARFGTGVRCVAVDDGAFIMSQFYLSRLIPDASFVPAYEFLAPLRALKDEEEIAKIRRAAQLTDTLMSELLRVLKPGVSEFEVAAEVDYQIMKLGAEGPSYTTGVSFSGPGRNRSIFVRTSSSALRHGDCVSFDFGLVLDGYCSDFGRSVFVGEPSAEFLRAREIVMRSQAEAIAALKGSRITAGQADAVARNVIESEGYGHAFIHHLGHGIGVDVHEPPFLDRGDETMLQAGMCLALEPSIWTNDLLCRVEDVVLVGTDGGQLLNQFSHDLLIVDC